MDIAQIHRRFGPGGIRDFASAYGRVGAITDDTQMTLFTAEGLIRSAVRHAGKGICHVPSVVHRAYVRWLRTQGYALPKLASEIVSDAWLNDGWLIGIGALWSRRAPGNTCLSALRNTKQMGEPAKNDSKGCGGVMRVAPVGLLANRDRAFELGSQTAALTHGHSSGYLAAGFLALLIEEIVSGASLEEAINTAKADLIAQPGHEEVLKAVENAEALARLGGANGMVSKLGQGWVAEEALAIGLYCTLAAPDFEQALILAVNHSGDSDCWGNQSPNISRPGQST